MPRRISISPRRTYRTKPNSGSNSSVIGPAVSRTCSVYMLAGEVSHALLHRSLEVALCEFGLTVERLFPAKAGFVRLPSAFQRVAEVEECFCKVGLLKDGFAIELDCILDLSGLLQQQAGVVQKLGGLLAEVD